MISRARLYALGEPLGDAATRIEAGRMIMGGGGSSSSSSQQATTTTNTDNRQAISSGAVGVTAASGSNLSITNTSADPAVVSKAMDTIAASDAANGAGFSQLLGLADKMFTAGGNLINQQSQATMQQIGALQTTANNQSGKIDQKTMIIMGVVSLGALAVLRKKG